MEANDENVQTQDLETLDEDYYLRAQQLEERLDRMESRRDKEDKLANWIENSVYPIKIQSIENKGMGVIATSEIPNETVIFECAPYCCVVYEEKKQFVCAYCFKEPPHLEKPSNENKEFEKKSEDLNNNDDSNHTNHSNLEIDNKKCKNFNLINEQECVDNNNNNNNIDDYDDANNNNNNNNDLNENNNLQDSNCNNVNIFDFFPPENNNNNIEICNDNDKYPGCEISQIKINDLNISVNDNNNNNNNTCYMGDNVLIQNNYDEKSTDDNQITSHNDYKDSDVNNSSPDSFPFDYSNIESLIQCEYCKHVYYCSEECRNADWDEHSAYECSSLARFDVDTARSEYQYCDYLITDIRLLLKIMNKRRYKIDLGIDNSDDDEYDLLISNMDCYTPEVLESLSYVCKYALYLISEDAAIPEEELLDIYCKNRVNMFGLWGVDGSCIGYGIYPQASYFNHSCWPNAVFYRNNETKIPYMNFLTVWPIEAGEEVSISYIDISKNLFTRRTTLLDKYFFHCTCPRCELQQNSPEAPDPYFTYCTPNHTNENLPDCQNDGNFDEPINSDVHINNEESSIDIINNADTIETTA